MPKKELQFIAEKAKFIVSGYAFSKREDITLRKTRSPSDDVRDNSNPLR